MRIVAGILKGRHIEPPKSFDARPTTDFAKEGLFNVLNNYFNFESVRALDLFAGSGNISFELFSRGCSDITAIEINDKYVKSIISYAARFDCNSIQVLKTDVYGFLKHCRQTYDIIFADPPYQEANYQLINELVFSNQLLRENGWLIMEHSRDTDLSKLQNFKQLRKYAGVNFSVFYIENY